MWSAGREQPPPGQEPPPSPEQPDEDENDDDEEGEETIAEDREQEFDFKEFIKRFMTAKVLEPYCWLLRYFDTNTPEANHCVLKMLHRVAWDHHMSAMLFQASLFRTFQRMMDDVRHSRNPALKELIRFAKFVLRKFFAVAATNKKVFMEILFWKSPREAYEVEHGYDTYQETSKASKVSWSEEEEDELARVYEELRAVETNDPERDLLDRILDTLICRERTRRQVAKKLKTLGLISDTRQLKGRSAPAGPPREWTEQEVAELTELWSRYRDAADPLSMIFDHLTVRRPKNRIRDKLLALGLATDKKQLYKKRAGGRRRPTDPTGPEDEDGVQRGSGSDSDSDGGSDSGSDGERAVPSRHGEAAREVLTWLQESLEEAVALRRADPDEAVALVPVSETCAQALETDDGRRLVTLLGGQQPGDGEMFWRWPAALATDVLDRNAGLLADWLTGDGPPTRDGADSEKENDDPAGAELSRSLHVDSSSEDEQQTLTRPTQRSRLLSSEDEQQTLTRPTQRSRLLSSEDEQQTLTRPTQRSRLLSSGDENEPDVTSDAQRKTVTTVLSFSAAGREQPPPGQEPPPSPEQPGEDENDDDEEEEETIAEDREQEFDFKEFIKRFMTAKVLEPYCWLLRYFDTNTPEANHCVLKMLHRVAWDHHMSAMLFQASLFRTFQRMMDDVRHSRNPALKELIRFAKFVLRKFFAVAATNKKVFMEILFWKSPREAYEVEHGYDTYQETSKASKVSWSEEEEDELTRVYEELRAVETNDPERDLLDRILDTLICRERTRRQVAKKLKTLGLISDTRQLKGRSAPAGPPREWTEQEVAELTELWSRYRDAADPLSMIFDHLTVRRPKNRIRDKLLALGLATDKKQLYKKRAGGRRRPTDPTGPEDEDGLAAAVSAYMQPDGEAAREVLTWLQESLEEAVALRRADPDEAVALVPVSETCAQALETDDGRRLVTLLGGQQPGDGEMFWRWPAALATDVLDRNAGLLADWLTGDGPPTRDGADSEKENDDPAGAELSRSLHVDSSSEDEQQTLTRPTQRSRLLSSEDEQQTLTRPTQRSRLLSSGDENEPDVTSDAQRSKEAQPREGSVSNKAVSGRRGRVSQVTSDSDEETPNRPPPDAATANQRNSAAPVTSDSDEEMPSVRPHETSASQRSRVTRVTSDSDDADEARRPAGPGVGSDPAADLGDVAEGKRAMTSGDEGSDVEARRATGAAQKRSRRMIESDSD
ncbi:uncharacterized protein LOC119111135 [Pollicipes pollicipes]|uniref:uncharacterized protein LOC119111135 n=1 Tax=Pollicipes pollicipes TaxID=41117 RepID=UPI00188513A1|nr:uncharacterized protein LOC119111135 [Pollicipes pollicipes]